MHALRLRCNVCNLCSYFPTEMTDGSLSLLTCVIGARYRLYTGGADSAHTGTSNEALDQLIAFPTKAAVKTRWLFNPRATIVRAAILVSNCHTRSFLHEEGAAAPVRDGEPVTRRSRPPPISASVVSVYCPAGQLSVRLLTFPHKHAHYVSSCRMPFDPSLHRFL